MLDVRLVGLVFVIADQVLVRRAGSDHRRTGFTLSARLGRAAGFIIIRSFTARVRRLAVAVAFNGLRPAVAPHPLAFATATMTAPSSATPAAPGLIAFLFGGWLALIAWLRFGLFRFLGVVGALRFCGCWLRGFLTILRLRVGLIPASASTAPASSMAPTAPVVLLLNGAGRFAHGLGSVIEIDDVAFRFGLG
jgi:hypothetical protein